MKEFFKYHLPHFIFWVLALLVHVWLYATVLSCFHYIPDRPAAGEHNGVVISAEDRKSSVWAACVSVRSVVRRLFSSTS